MDQPDPGAQPERGSDLVGEEGAERLAGDPLHDLPDQEPKVML